MDRRLFLKLIAGAGAAAGLNAFRPRGVQPAAAAGPIYWGAYLSGNHYGINPATSQPYGAPPWDLATWDLFEAHANKRMSILHWGQPWYAGNAWPYGYTPFPTAQVNTVRSRGAIPLIDWGSWDSAAGSSVNQPSYSLSNILAGAHDAYITQWATAAKAWGYPFFLRFDWEMNGNWFPWSERVNGNSAGQYVQVWRRVHDIFTAVGANNVTWVWCPNIDSSTMIPMASLYPGDAYVDWVGLDGYNKYPNFFLAFATVFAGQGITWLYNSYSTLRSLAPSKPIMIAETASKEAGDGGAQKAAWITDMLATQLPLNFPEIKAVLWFNWNRDAGLEYVIESTPAAQAAFAAGISNAYYAANSFAGLPAGSKVPVPSSNPPTPVPSATVAAPTNTQLPTVTRTATTPPTATRAATNAPTATRTATTPPTATRTATTPPTATRTATTAPTATRTATAQPTSNRPPTKTPRPK